MRNGTVPPVPRGYRFTKRIDYIHVAVNTMLQGLKVAANFVAYEFWRLACFKPF